MVCRAGACGACAVGAVCDGAAGHAPALSSPNPCQTYGTFCNSGTPACGATGNVPDGTACPSGGTNYVCRAGTCTAPGYQLVVLTPAGQLNALPNQQLSVKLQLQDVVSHGAVLTPTPVTWAAPAGAQAPAPANTSSTDGTVTFTPTLGRAVGVQHFTATAPGAYAPLDVQLTAVAPADGVLIPIANAAHVNASSIASGAAPALPTGQTIGIAVASDGTVYFSDTNCTVKRVLPSGQLDVVAGTGNCTNSTLVGPATTIPLYRPRGLGLDESGHTLYIV
jgi:hypothetical protein